MTGTPATSFPVSSAPARGANAEVASEQVPLQILDVPSKGVEVDGFHLLAPAAQQPRIDCWQNILRFPPHLPVEHYLPRDPHPLPAIVDREGYHGERHYAYWVSGLHDYLEMTAAMKRHGVELKPGDEILDLGCASGRTMRHFACQGDGLKVWGVDIKKRNVEWCTRFLPANIRPVLGTNVPNLPIADNSLALAYAFSVFTHIDEYEFAWLAELHRVLRPGGIAYLTIHSERLWTGMTREHPIWLDILSHEKSPETPIELEQFKHPMPQDRMVLRMGLHMGNVNVFHSDRYIHNVWGRLFEVAQFIEPPGTVQAQLVLIKK